MTTAHTDAESAAVEAMTMFGGGGDDDDDDEGRLLLWYQWLLVKTLRAWCAPPPALTFAAQIYHPALSSTPVPRKSLESPRACHTRHAASLSAGPLCLRPRGLNRCPPDCRRPNVADQRCFAVRRARTRSQGRAAFWARSPRGSIPKQLWAPSALGLLSSAQA